MSDTTTPNYNFVLPSIGASQDTWGNKLNANWAEADAVIYALASGYLTLSGGVINGGLTISPPSGSALLELNKPAGTASNASEILGTTAGVLRWVVAVGTAEAESGSNAGSNFGIYRYDDGGNNLGEPLGINRATGNVSIAQALSVGGALSSGGALSVGGSLTASGGVTGGQITSTGGYFVVAPNYYLVRSSSDGAWRFVENGNTHFTLDAVGNLTIPGSFSAPHAVCSDFGGGPGGAASLHCWNTANQLTFRWYGGQNLAYRIDEAVEFSICTQSNAQDLQVFSTSGGPTGVGLGFADRSGTRGSCYADGWSDVRIKQDIRPTEVDALSLVEAIPVRAFSYTPAMADLYASMGKRQRVAGDADVRIGFVAQELQEHIPEAVYRLPGDVHQPDGSPLPDDALLIAQQPIVPFLVRAVQQLAARLAALEAPRSA